MKLTIPLFFLTSNMTTFTTAFTTLSRSFTRTSARSMSSSAKGGAFRRSLQMNAESGQAEVVLVGCGAPNRGMGWYHGIQMVEQK
jgi:hypothetical protein